ncbi:hypothetical protein L1987_65189 [Smallanthus sonchifolius]|uniref:Uncharacterized protein n=1 Tax=Smallanthus sonchifolius TaxID=185202 RepID=A0ACB9BTL8_9ASTR|nr:hypothetical protein L1987_65189 [Smallanthus sonchifolius]
MIVLFGRCGCMNEACRLFVDMKEKDLVSWTAMISSYEQGGTYEDALVMFFEMNRRGIDVDEVEYISVSSACAYTLVLETGACIHGLVFKTGTSSYVNIHNALIHMYSTCADIQMLRNSLIRVPTRILFLRTR